MPREGYTYERIVILIAQYGAETWNMGATEKKRLNIEALRCVKSLCGITLINRAKMRIYVELWLSESWLMEQSRKYCDVWTRRHGRRGFGKEDNRV